MPDPVRFPAQIPYDDSGPCLEVFSAIVAGDWTLAQTRYNANPTATSNTMGAVRYWRDQFNPVGPVVIIEMQPFGGANYRHPFNLQGETYAFRFTVPEGPPLQVYGSTTVYEYGAGAPTAMRQACLSLTAGDFANPLGGYVSQGVQASVIWTRGDGSDYQKLVPGVYFFNTRIVDYVSGVFPSQVETMWPK